MPKRSLAARAMLALALMVGFYLLALGIAGLLFYLPYAEWRYLDRVDLRLVVFGLAGGLGILAAALPRVDRFPDPGPELTPAAHPRLFDAITGVARSTNQAMPAQVFLVPDVNAWVAQRGGIMGFGGRRVMGLGLPLLRVLSPSELRAVLAHEFGHFDAGDTALGPWLYKTRAAIERTLENLKDRGSWLSLPFVWYGKAFVRLTHGMSRQQEFAADNLAARMVGPSALRHGLEKIHRVAPAFTPYWIEEVAPLLDQGVRPPLAEGFSIFLAAPMIAQQADALLARELAEGKSDPYDTHPPLRDRLAALTGVPELPFEHEEATALSLVSDVDGLEERLMPFVVPAGAASGIVARQWEEMPKAVWLPRWATLVEKNRKQLSGLTPETVLPLVSRPKDLAVRFGLAARPDVASDRHVHEARFLVLCAINVALHEAGWSVRTPPGGDVVFSRGTLSLVPALLLDRVAGGDLSPEAAVNEVASSGIAGRDLGTLG